MIPERIIFVSRGITVQMYGLLNSKMELGRMTFCERVNKGYISTILIGGRKSWTAAEDVPPFSRIVSHTMNTPSVV